MRRIRLLLTRLLIAIPIVIQGCQNGGVGAYAPDDSRPDADGAGDFFMDAAELEPSLDARLEPDSFGVSRRRRYPK